MRGMWVMMGIVLLEVLRMLVEVVQMFFVSKSS